MEKNNLKDSILNSDQLEPGSFRKRFSSSSRCLFLLLVFVLILSVPLSAWAEKASNIDLTPEEKAWLDKNHTVRVRFVDFPPFSIVKKDQAPSGITIEYLNLIARRTGIKFKFNVSKRPFAQALKSMQDRKGPDLIANMMRTTDREKTLSFARDYLAMPRVVFTRTDGQFISSLDDLNGRIIAVPRGTVIHKRIRKMYPDIQLLLLDTDLKSLEAVATGQADAYVGNLTIASYLILKRGLNNLKVAAPTPFGDHVFSYGNRKDWPELSSIINKGMDSITPEEKGRIQNKYVAMRFEHGINAEDILKWILIAAGAISGVMLIFVFWNRGLAKQVNKRTSELASSKESLEAEIAERKQAEEVVKKSERRLSESQRIARIGNWELDLITNELFWSDEVYRLFGLKPQQFDASYEAFLDNIHPDDRDLVNKAYTDSLKNKTPYQIAHRLLLKDKTVKYVNETCETYYDDSGEAIRSVGTVQDITEQRNLEEQFRQSQKMEAIGKLSGGVAHDFNNLLTSITGNADLLSLKLEKDSPLKEFVVEITKASDRAASLTRQLLAFSREQVLQPKVMSLNEVIVDMEKMLRRLIGEDIDLKTTLSNELGNVKADPGQVEQVILNLCVNARDAMPQGGKITIETANEDLDESYARTHRTVIPGPYVMMAISDDGSGMDKETQSRIFDPFFTTKEQGKGTGLGLSTVYGIVKQSEGNILVYSEPDQGTTFKVYLPRVEKPVEKSAKTKEPFKSLTGTETILLVEDDGMVRKVAHEVLKGYGYKILVAENGKEALEICGENKGPIHLMLTDVVMPEMSGKKLAEHLQDSRPEIKVLYMSGYTDNTIVHHGILDKGMNFIQKPFTPETLGVKIRGMLDEK